MRRADAVCAHLTALADRLVGITLASGRWLVLPVVVLLFLQWPLRDLLRASSREANDLGQWLFAIYVAVSVTCATRERTHLAADMLARFYPQDVRRALARIGALLLVPWAAFALWSGGGIVLDSIRIQESFPDTANPGYFLVKAALWILAGLILLQALIDIVRPSRRNVD